MTIFALAVVVLKAIFVIAIVNFIYILVRDWKKLRMDII